MSRLPGQLQTTTNLFCNILLSFPTALRVKGLWVMALPFQNLLLNEQLPHFCTYEEQLKFPNYTAAIKTLKKKIDDSGQFYLVVRRSCPFLRQLSLWQREARKRSPEKALMVKFAAEDGRDV